MTTTTPVSEVKAKAEKKMNKMNRNRWIDQNRWNKTVKKEHIYILDRKQPKQSALWKIKKKKNEQEKDSKGSESKRAKKNGKDLSFRHRRRTKEQCGASKTEVNTNKDWKTKRG